MGLFVTSTAGLQRHDVYAVKRRPPAVIQNPNSAIACIVGQFPWGADGLIIEPENVGDRVKKIAPAGMTRTGSGYLSTIAKTFGPLRLIRAIDAAAVKATAALQDAVPATIMTVTLLCKGTEGNSVICTVADASDGDANKFNLTVSVTGASGSTEELFENINVSGVGADSLPDLTNAVLTGAVAKTLAGRPLNGSTTCSTGTNGTIDATTYVGTAGTGDKGMALAEGDRTIRHIFTDDPSNALRAAVNAGLKAHLTLMGDRNGYTNGDSGMTAANTRTDAALYRSDDLVYVDPWPYIYDDVDGTKRLVPPASFAASVACQLPPSTAISWKHPEVQAMLGGIVGLETAREASAGDNSDAGVCTLIREESGGYTFEADVVTNYPAASGTYYLHESRMDKSLAVGVKKAWRPYVDAPNLEVYQDEMVAALDRYLGVLKAASKSDPAHNMHVKDYVLNAGEIAGENTDTTVQQGEFHVPTHVKYSASMRKIIFSLESGELVVLAAH